MTRLQKVSIVLLRIVIGWFFLYQGVNALLTPQWSLPFIANAHTFPDFYKAVINPGMLPFVTLLFKGLFLLVGLALILGIFARLAAFLGILMMLFFYFPLLQFPYVDEVYYVVDYRIIVCVALLFLYTIRAGDFFGLGSMWPFSRHHHHEF